jgi:hypothetical protein
MPQLKISSYHNERSDEYKVRWKSLFHIQRLGWRRRRKNSCKMYFTIAFPQITRNSKEIPSHWFVAMHISLPAKETTVEKLLPSKMLCSNKIARRSLLPKYYMVSWCMRDCNSIYAHRKSKAFLPPGFMKITRAQHQCAKTLYIEFYSFLYRCIYFHCHNGRNNLALLEVHNFTCKAIPWTRLFLEKIGDVRYWKKKKMLLQSATVVYVM